MMTRLQPARRNRPGRISAWRRGAAVLFVLLTAPALWAEPPLPVPVMTVQPVENRSVLSLTGEIVARDETRLSFPMGGRILDVAVREGDRVEAGQELARLESVQQEQALREAEAALEAAQADLQQAREEFFRQDQSLRRGATTRIRRDEAERRYRIAEAGVDRARANLNRAQKTYDDTFLRAPAAGVVTDRLADPGEVVAAAHPVLVLASGEGLDAVFDAPEVLPAAALSNPVIRLELIDRPEIAFTGRVREISPLVDPRKGTVQVKIGVRDAPAIVRFGDAVRGMIEIRGPARITVPASALAAIGHGPGVWVLDGNGSSVRAVPVRIERFSDGDVVIAEGLVPGDRVVTGGTQLLYPGRVVRAREESQ